MKYSIYIDQVKMVEWSLSPSLGILFSYLYELPSWARPYKNTDYYFVSQSKLEDELPGLKIGERAVRKYLESLEEKELIERMTISNQRYVRLTDKAKTWGRAQGRNKSSGKVGTNDPAGRNKSSGKVGTNDPAGRNKSSGKVGTNDPAGRNKSSGDHITRSYNHDQKKEEGSLLSVDNFLMYLEWQPGNSFSSLCKLRNVNLDSVANLKDVIAEFVSYWHSQKNINLNQDEWEHKLVGHIKRTIPRQGVLVINGKSYSMPSMYDDKGMLSLADVLGVSLTGLQKQHAFDKLSKKFDERLKGIA